MAITAPAQTIADVVALLCPVTGKKPREIWSQLPLTYPRSVNNALLVLVRDGRATFEGEMCKRRYRLVEPAL